MPQTYKNVPKGELNSKIPKWSATMMVPHDKYVKRKVHIKNLINNCLLSGIIFHLSCFTVSYSITENNADFHKFEVKFYKKSSHKTVIFISHRLSTTRDADRIYMMEKGSIIEEGIHEETSYNERQVFDDMESTGRAVSSIISSILG